MWAPLGAVHREQLLGFPVDHAKTKTTKEASVENEDLRSDMLGDSFHVPSVRIILVVLLLLLQTSSSGAALASPQTCGVQHVPREPGQRVAAGVLEYLGSLPEPLRFMALPFASLFDSPSTGGNVFFDHCTAEGMAYSGAPDLSEHELTGLACWSQDKQAGGHLHKHGLPRWVPGGLNAEEHWTEAHRIFKAAGHLFAHRGVRAADTQVAIIRSCEMGRGLAAWRRRVLVSLELKQRQLAALSTLARGAMSPRVRSVAGKHEVGFLLYMCVALHWPDRHFVKNVIVGSPWWVTLRRRASAGAA